ncbi:hypothetical protein SLEP1_g36690 [Rubroshorea leprosula]|uniref:Uncharacterized protein n=1 Tax=Rubroshorea leprosula TaxID=152421 RepID=A0AAV5KSK1_9ROSI|nr:hypothetical protein SLEP1_g36690 [Rubroshorea leprosula]
MNLSILLVCKPSNEEINRMTDEWWQMLFKSQENNKLERVGANISLHQNHLDKLEPRGKSDYHWSSLGLQF